MGDRAPLKVGDQFICEPAGVAGEITDIMCDTQGEPLSIVVRAPCGCCWYAIDLRPWPGWESHRLH